MMIVVPSFAECEHSDEDVVPALVTTSVGLRSPDVAHRIHATGDVVNHHDPNQTTPDEPQESAEPEALADQEIRQSTEDRRNHEADSDPEGEQAADGPDSSVPDQVGNVTIQRFPGSVEDPPDMRVPEAGDDSSSP